MGRGANKTEHFGHNSNQTFGTKTTECHHKKKKAPEEMTASFLVADSWNRRRQSRWRKSDIALYISKMAVQSLRSSSGKLKMKRTFVCHHCDDTKRATRYAMERAKHRLGTFLQS